MSVTWPNFICIVTSTYTHHLSDKGTTNMCPELSNAAPLINFSYDNSQSPTPVNTSSFCGIGMSFTNHILPAFGIGCSSRLTLPGVTLTLGSPLLFHILRVSRFLNFIGPDNAGPSSDDHVSRFTYNRSRPLQSVILFVFTRLVYNALVLILSAYIESPPNRSFYGT